MTCIWIRHKKKWIRHQIYESTTLYHESVSFISGGFRLKGAWLLEIACEFIFWWENNALFRPVVCCVVLSGDVLSCVIVSWCGLCCIVLSYVILSCLVLSCLVLSCGLVSSQVWSCLVLSFRVSTLTSTTNVLHNHLAPAQHSLSRNSLIVVTSQRNATGGRKPTLREDLTS